MAPVTDPTARRLHAALARAQREGRVPSVVATLIRDGEAVWGSDIGSATGAEAAPADLQYRIGSVTKTMTAVLILRLRDEGRLDLGQEVADLLPDVPWAGVTVRSLLAHASGIAAEPVGEWWERSPGRSWDALIEGLRVSEPPFATGRTHHYSNTGFALLGEIVARLEGRPWWDCVRDRLLVPLGMGRTTYLPEAPFAQGYSVAPFAPTLTREPATDTGAMAPAGQLWSTVGDLAAYAAFLATGHPAVVPLDTLEEMSTPQAGTYADGLSSGYGLGLRLTPGGSGTLVGHTGSMPGFQCCVFVDRPRRAGVVVMANSTRGLATDAVGRELLELLEDCEPTVVRPWTPVSAVPPEIDAVLGLWHWGNSPLLLSWDGDRLTMSDALTGEPGSSFRLAGPRLVGMSGYHHGEAIDVVRRDDGSVGHLMCSTFVLTRSPYDPTAPTPGGTPTDG